MLFNVTTPPPENSKWIEIPYQNVITLKSPASFASTYWPRHVCKCGNILQIDVLIQIQSSINGASFGTIAQGYRPFRNVYIDASGTSKMIAFINTAGELFGYVDPGEYQIHLMYAI